MFESVLSEFNTYVETIKTPDFQVVPHDYKGNISSNQFIKYMVVFNKTDRKSYDSNRHVPGFVLLSIFYPSGRGQGVPTAKADELLSTFEDKAPIPGLSTELASLNFMGTDPSNKTLSRADLTIPFNYYGD